MLWYARKIPGKYTRMYFDMQIKFLENTQEWSEIRE